MAVHLRACILEICFLVLVAFVTVSEAGQGDFTTESAGPPFVLDPNYAEDSGTIGKTLWLTGSGILTVAASYRLQWTRLLFLSLTDPKSNFASRSIFG